MIRPVTRRATFLALARSARRVQFGALSVAWIEQSELGPPRVALAVNRRVGNAVVRNQVRRRLREAARRLAAPPNPQLAPGIYLVGASPAIAELTFWDLLDHFQGALRALAARPTAPSPTPR